MAIEPARHVRNKRETERYVVINGAVWRRLENEALRRGVGVTQLAIDLLSRECTTPLPASPSTSATVTEPSPVPTRVVDPPASEPRPSPPPKRERRARCSITVDPDTWDALRHEARKRGTTAAELGAQVVMWTLVDGLIDAVLDGGT